MLDTMLDRLTVYLDAAAAFLWRMFEKDMALTESVIRHTETLYDVLFKKKMR